MNILISALEKIIGSWQSKKYMKIANKIAVEYFAGLFIYQGLGSGTYYSNTGEEMSLTKTEAVNQAKEEKEEFVYIDIDQINDMADQLKRGVSDVIIPAELMGKVLLNKSYKDQYESLNYQGKMDDHYGKANPFY